MSTYLTGKEDSREDIRDTAGAHGSRVHPWYNLGGETRKVNRGHITHQGAKGNTPRKSESIIPSISVAVRQSVYEGRSTRGETRGETKGASEIVGGGFSPDLPFSFRSTLLHVLSIHRPKLYGAGSPSGRLSLSAPVPCFLRNGELTSLPRDEAGLEHLLHDLRTAQLRCLTDLLRPLFHTI